MKRSKQQQYFHCFIVRILVTCAFWFSCQQNKVTILISATFRGAALIRGETLISIRRLFQCGYPKVQCLLEGEAHLSPDAYQRKYGIRKKHQLVTKAIIESYYGKNVLKICGKLLKIPEKEKEGFLHMCFSRILSTF